MKKSEELYFTHNNNKYNRYTPEQHLWINCLRKNNKNISCDYQHDINENIIEESERFLVSNFICINYDQFNLRAPARLKSHLYADLIDIITHIEWQQLYKKYLYQPLEITEYDSLRYSLTEQHKKLNRYKKISKLLFAWIPFRKIRRSYRKKTYEYLVNKYL